MHHSPDSPALCPKCGGKMRRHDGASNLMVCENSISRPEKIVMWGPPIPAIVATCDLEPMYLV